MKSYFYDLADYTQSLLQGSEFYTAWFGGEDSSFCRVNHAKIRQVGDVQLNEMTVRLIDGKRSVSKSTTLTGMVDEDRSRLKSVVGELRTQLPSVTEDPYLLYATDVNSTESERESNSGGASEILDHVLSSCQQDDLVGILAAGPVYRGFANSAGQRNWHRVDSFNFDYSLYHSGDKAVKGAFAGFDFDGAAFDARVAVDREQLSILKKPVREIKPGTFRAYLAPAALQEFTDLLSWGGFGKKSQATKRTQLIQLVEGEKTLSPMVTLQEATLESGAPAFNRDGYIKPDAVDLISAGKFAGALVSPRSAKEYDVPTNGAGDSEGPGSLSMAAGTIRRSDILAELGEGLYINNTWYLNFSDRKTCRMTGMTRFAAFWVENGEIKAPLNVMRFDDSIYRLLGDNLVGLTAERDFMPSPATYGGRDLDSTCLPGALVSGFSLTL